MTLAVAAGDVCSNNTFRAVTAGNVTIGAADATHPRIDLVVVNNAGTKAVRAGTPGTPPKPPARTTNDVVLAYVYIAANETAIEEEMVVDQRVITLPGRYLIRADATRTFTSNTSEQAIFTNPTNGRVTLGIGTYVFRGILYVTGMSATSGNAAIDLLGAGTATVASWLWHAWGIDATAPTAAAAQTGAFTITQQSVASVVVAATGTAMAISFQGTFEVTAAGTLIPSLTMVTASASVVAVGSFVEIERVGDVNTVSVGPWD
jgi:hypothetical protein